jgi:WhiB family transcriptional regulator, redox-sensing transcriptional regulator
MTVHPESALAGAGRSFAQWGMNVTAGDPRPLLAILSGDGSIGADLAWQDRGTCAGIGQEFFYLGVGGNSRPAKAVCRTCPVRRECLADALEHSGDFGSGLHGIWGGTSPEEREDLRRQFPGDVTAAVDFALREAAAASQTDRTEEKAA